MDKQDGAFNILMGKSTRPLSSVLLQVLTYQMTNRLSIIR